MREPTEEAHKKRGRRVHEDMVKISKVRRKRWERRWRREGISPWFLLFLFILKGKHAPKVRCSHICWLFTLFECIERRRRSKRRNIWEGEEDMVSHEQEEDWTWSGSKRSEGGKFDCWRRIISCVFDLSEGC